MTVSKIKNLVLTFAILFMVSQAYAGETFQTNSCEYLVEFPGDFSTRTIYDSKGNSTTQAKGKGENGDLFGAECWPRINNVIEGYAEKISLEMEKRGITIFNVLVEKNSKTPHTIATGTMNIADANLFIQMISYFGKMSRLDLFIIDERPLMSIQALEFRNSVKAFNK